MSGNWKYVDGTQKVVFRNLPNGCQESCLAEALPDVTPEPADVPDPKISITAEIDRLERESLLNRGSRELQLFLMEERASQVASTKGIPVASVLSANIYYGKLKALDLQVSELRGQLN